MRAERDEHGGAILDGSQGGRLVSRAARVVLWPVWQIWRLAPRVVRTATWERRQRPVSALTRWSQLGASA